ncbi:OLC1v1002147C1 [Oldenlandia corymbosa var. corymbosa]|uniref:OLC1v1002147C1 n=1 Tax=Oldenlandia corymbosa var. corymbosa TaxID=529605 RepID=A0AAV1D716_OLDCO|nr:OLC1v1002147C1 [Oldenlandia corymbosa var. corymbosa]
MKGMPLPFEFQGKGVLDLEVVVNSNKIGSCFWNRNIDNKKLICSPDNSEPNSVLDNIRSQSPSSSTLSSSLGCGNNSGGTASGGGGGAVSTGVAAVSGNSPIKWHQDAPSTTTSSNVGAESELHPVPPSLEMGGGGAGAAAAAAAPEKCTMEEWDSVLPESVAASPSQEQSILRWIMGDVDDPSMANLNKVLQIGGGGGSGGHTADYEFNGGFGVVDQGFGAEGQGINFMPSLNPSISTISSNRNNGGEKVGFLANSSGNLASNKLPNVQNPLFPALSSNLGGPMAFSQSQQPLMPAFEGGEMKPPIFNPQLLINQHQTHPQNNPSFFIPLGYGQQEQNLLMPPQAKRHNPGPIGGVDPSCQISKTQFSDTGQELFVGRQSPLQQQQGMPPVLPHQLQLLPNYVQQRPAAVSPKQKMVGDEMGLSHHQQQQQQQAIIDQLFKAAELVQSGNPLLAQGILARLNHQLSPIGKPFYRAAFYCKEALQMLLHTSNSLNPNSSPFSLVFKIGAYKSFSEISPIVQFANFTCIQALLEVLEGFDHIHIVDFDIGYGGQWASFMQELALRSGGAPSLKITAFASSSTHDQLELGLMRENLIHFASEISMPFEFEIVSIDAITSSSWSLPLRVSENEAVAVNLPVSSFSSCQLSLPLILRFVRQLSPKIVVSIDRGCDRTDLPFPNHVIHALQSYSNLLESLDAVNLNLDSLQKIERFLLQPGIERILSGRYRTPEKTQHWRTMFLSSGFSPLTFSNFTESQAECVVKRTPVRGFHVEKRQSSLVLCWQRKELISASAWRC